MKKTALFFTVLLLLITSCSKMESNERKFIKGLQSEDYETSAKAFDEFTNWLQSDRATMTHDFKLMQKELGLKVVTSPDSLLRCYSWLTAEQGERYAYANVIQWFVGDKFVAYGGPLNRLLADRSKEYSREFSRAHSIDTIFEITTGNRPVYLIVQSYVNNENKRRAMLSASAIINLRLTSLPFFFDGVELAGNNEFIDKGNTPISDLFKWDEKNQRLYAYQTDENDHLIPGKYAIYELGNERFTRISDE